VNNINSANIVSGTPRIYGCGKYCQYNKKQTLKFNYIALANIMVLKGTKCYKELKPNKI